MSLSLRQENGSTLASIIGSSPERLKKWESFKLYPDNEEFVPAQFHAMFWGKSMADEEQKWRDAQPPILVEGAGLENEHSGSGDEPTDSRSDASEEEESDSDDDIIEGCYSLEIGIDDFAFPRIWIRAEYIRIYNALEDRYRRPVYPYLASAVVITGQPGIGKSIFIYYALRRRLAEKMPVIWYYRETRYLFVEEGIYEVPDDFHDFKVFVWTLVDSDYAGDRIPGNLAVQDTRHFLIYCTSPNKKQWSRLHKTFHNYVFIMNPWKYKEILRVTSTLPPGTILHESVDSVFDELGPTPQLCVDYSCSRELMEQYRRDVQRVISSLTTSRLEQLSTDCCSLTMDEVSSKIFLICRQDKKNVHSRAIVSPITSTIKSRLASHFRIRR